MSLPAPNPDTKRSAKQTRAKQIRGPLRAALDAMIWEGLDRRKAAEKAGMTDHGLYSAFRKPHVKAAYLAEMEVLRLSERARNIVRLTQIRDAADNMPAVQAIKMLEQLGDDAAPAQRQIMPGLVVQLNIAQPAHQPLHVDARPLAALHGTVQDADNAQE